MQNRSKTTLLARILAISITLGVGFGLMTNPTYAADCTEAMSGSITVSSSCAFPGTYNGADAATSETDTINTADITVDAATLTINAGQTIVWGDELIVQNGGSIAINDTGQLTQGPMWYVDDDDDGYPTSVTPTIQSSRPGTAIRRAYLAGSGIGGTVGGNAYDGRIAVTVTSAGADTNHHTLLTMDTATKIGAAAMQADCDDIRVTDSDGTTEINYWIEGGCNTASTRIWTNIPSISSGDNTIYIYYGNGSVANAEQSWGQASPQLMQPATSSCAAGWASVTAANGYYLRGNTTAGGTGGASTHNHTITDTSGTDSGSEGGLVAAQNTATVDGHSHSVSVTVANANSTPAYEKTLLCGYSSDKGIPAEIPTNGISFFGTLPSSGWTRDVSFDSTYFLIDATPGGTGGSNTNHTHTFSGSLSSTAGTTVLRSGVSNIFINTHTHSGISGTTGSDTTEPPYLDMVVAAPSATFDMTTSTDPIVFASNFATLPPLGWTQYTGLNSKFPRGNSTSGGTGGATNSSHSYSDSSTGPSGSGALGSAGATLFATNSHTHSISGTTSSDSHLPLYYDTIFVQRTEDDTTKAYNDQGGSSGPSVPSAIVADYNDADNTCVINLSCYVDADSDGYTTSGTPSNYCGFDATCAEVNATYVASSSGTDPNDGDANCRVNYSCYVDADNDTYTVGTSGTQCKINACNNPTGHQASASSPDDCDDTNASLTTSCSKTMFVSDSQYDGAGIGGLSGADAKCATDATTHGLSGTFKAWMSDDSSSATSRLTHSSTDYKLPSGTVIANGWDDLVDGSVDNLINEFGDGSSAGVAGIWTGTDSDGTSHVNNCTNWTSNSSGVSGRIGRGDYTDTWWTSRSNNTCDSANRAILCIEQ